MKKILLGIALSVVALQGCKKDGDDEEEVVALTIEEQNTYDDAAATKFLDSHYFDSKGLIVAFDDKVDTDDNNPKLSSYSPVKLPSGVIYIVRPGAQPTVGKELATTDVLSLMQVTTSYVSAKVNEQIIFASSTVFSNNIEGSGVPTDDPAYYYVKSSVLKNYNTTYNTTHGRSFYEMEGLQEGLKYFKAFDLEPSADYNMQGVIIVPSRAAYARDANVFNYTNRSFVFNFQLYNAKTRNMQTED